MPVMPPQGHSSTSTRRPSTTIRAFRDCWERVGAGMRIHAPRAFWLEALSRMTVQNSHLMIPLDTFHLRLFPGSTGLPNPFDASRPRRRGSYALVTLYFTSVCHARISFGSGILNHFLANAEFRTDHHSWLVGEKQCFKNTIINK
jgi:hypothetical protein